jgi:transcriptional regulator with XRE-family HTH domain
MEAHTMKIGNKIRKVRELKNITPKDMADRLNMSTQGYSKIERDEVALNIDRLLEIAGIFEMKPEDLLTFDEKQVFNNYGEMKDQSVIGVFSGSQNNFPAEMKDLYEKQIKLLEEQNQYLKERIKTLEGK